MQTNKYRLFNGYNMSLVYRRITPANISCNRKTVCVYLPKNESWTYFQSSSASNYASLASSPAIQTHIGRFCFSRFWQRSAGSPVMKTFNDFPIPSSLIPMAESRQDWYSKRAHHMIEQRSGNRSIRHPEWESGIAEKQFPGIEMINV